MVKDEIILGHRVSNRGIEVNKAKIDLIEKMEPPISMKEIRSFWVTLVSIGESLRTSPKLLSH